MKIYKDTDLTKFKFWAGVKEHEFTKSELLQIQATLEEIYENEISETQINDLFWFEGEVLCGWIGIDYDEYLTR